MKATALFATILLFLSAEAKFLPREKTIYYKLGEKTIPLLVSEYGTSNDIVCINLHNNEITSVMAARTVLETHGGMLIRIENNYQRVVKFKLKGVTYAFDPNRIFSRTGIEQSLKENGRTNEMAIEEIERFASRILELIPESNKCIIALHNNTEGAYSIDSYIEGGDRHNDAKAAKKFDDQDPDDIAFTTDEQIYQRMVEEGYNSIWQDNQGVKKDGSLSVYCGEKLMRS